MISRSAGSWRVAAVVAAAAVLVIGCKKADSTSAGATHDASTGKPPPVAPKARAVDAAVASAEPVAVEPGSICTLLTQEDASAAMGEPAQGGPENSDECWWSSANDLKRINLIRNRREADEAEAALETWRSGYANDHWKKIEMGDEAYEGKTLDSISFRVGTTTYDVNVVYSTAGDPRKIVEELAPKVFARVKAAPPE